MITKDGKKVKVVYDKKVPNKRKIINEDGENKIFNLIITDDLSTYEIN